MSICVCAATPDELAALDGDLAARPFRNTGSCVLRKGALRGSEVYTAVLGVGVANAALSLGGLIAATPIDALIMIGSAGAMPDSGLEPTDLVVAASEAFCELGVCSDGVAAEGLDLPGLDREVFFDHELTERLAAAAASAGRCLTGKLLTVAGVSATIAQARARGLRFGALAENMEGFAAALAGSRLGSRVAEVRAVSNIAGNRDKTSWRLKEANEAVQRAAMSFMRGFL